MSSLETYSTRLCPWLRDAFDSLAEAQHNDCLGHALLVTGPTGVGKLNLALATANHLLSTPPEIPGDLCAADVSASTAGLYAPSDHHPDLQWIFPDQEKKTRSITVDQIREAEHGLSLTSLHGKRKVVVIDPADTLTRAAANALLKTLEEPASDTYLLLLSEQPGNLPATIRSRCQIVAVPRPDGESALAWLQTHPNAPERDGWQALLALANGAPFYALALLDMEYLIKNSILEDQFDLISRNKLDPQTLADEWSKAGMALPLGWLTTRLQHEIRARMATDDSNPVTVLRSDRLHNAWQALTLDGLFRRLDAAEKLLSQIGSGTNADLALRSLLMAFHPRRGRT